MEKRALVQPNRATHLTWRIQDDFVMTSQGNYFWLVTSSGVRLSFSGTNNPGNASAGGDNVNTVGWMLRSTVLNPFASFTFDEFDYMSIIAAVDQTTDTDFCVGVHTDITQTFPTSGAANNGIWFQFKTSVSANWLVRCMKAGALSSTTSGIAVAANTYYLLEAIRNRVDNTISMKINGTTVATITVTNIPATNAGLDVGLHVDSLNAGVQKYARVDYIDIGGNIQGTRYT